MVYKTLKQRLEDSVYTSNIGYAPLQDKIHDAVNILSNKTTRWAKRQIQYKLKQKEIFGEIETGLSNGYISRDEATAAYESLNGLNKELSDYSYLKNRVADKDKVHRRMQFNNERTNRIKGSIDDYVSNDVDNVGPEQVVATRRHSFWQNVASYGKKAACYALMSALLFSNLSSASNNGYKSNPRSDDNPKPLKKDYDPNKYKKEVSSKSNDPNDVMRKAVDKVIAGNQVNDPNEINAIVLASSYDPNDSNGVVTVKEPELIGVNEPNDCNVCDDIGFERLQYLKDKMWDYPNRIDELRKELDSQGKHLSAGAAQIGFGLAVLNDLVEYPVVRPVAGAAGGAIAETQKAAYNFSRGVEGFIGGIMGTLEGVIFQNGNNYDNGSKESKGTISRILRAVSGTAGGIAGTAEGIVLQNGNNFEKGYKDADKFMDDTLLFIFNPDNNFEKGYKDGDQFGAFVMDGVFGGQSKNSFDSYLLQGKFKEMIAVPYCMEGEENELAGHIKLAEIVVVDALPWIKLFEGGGGSSNNAPAHGGGRIDGPLGGGGRVAGGLGR